MTGKIEVEISERGTGTIWIDNPSHRNAMNNRLIEELIRAFDSLSDDPQCRCVVLRGREQLFCAGRELRDLQALTGATLEEIVAAYQRLKRLNEAIHFCSKPTICVVERFAFGLGATLVSWCDMALAESDAMIAYPEVHHGIVPAPVVMALVRGLPRKFAMDLLLTGRRVKMDEALRIGLVSRCVPQGGIDEELDSMTRSILRGSPAAIRRTKEFVWHSEDAGHRSAMASAVDSISAGLASPEAREGIGAFLEKRLPSWASQIM